MSIQFDMENKAYLVFISTYDLFDFLDKHPTFLYKSIACFNGFENALRLED